MTASPLSLFFLRWANFRGRSTPREFWWPFGVYVLLTVVYNGVTVHGETALQILDVLRTAFHLVILVPALSLGFRRLHDRGCGGQWLLVGLIPALGPLILLVLLAGRSRHEFPEFPDYRDERPARTYFSADTAARVDQAWLYMTGAATVGAVYLVLTTVSRILPRP